MLPDPTELLAVAVVKSDPCLIAIKAKFLSRPTPVVGFWVIKTTESDPTDCMRVTTTAEFCSLDIVIAGAT